MFFNICFLTCISKMRILLLANFDRKFFQIRNSNFHVFLSMSGLFFHFF